VGSSVSLFPIDGDATGVSTTGLRYPLDSDGLAMGRSRGLSNVVTDERARVEVGAGALLVVEVAANEETSGG
jgi:thiamine pyrophosphokinase